MLAGILSPVGAEQSRGIVIQDPRTMTFMDWALRVYDDLQNPLVVQPVSEPQWREWALNMVLALGYNLPNPYEYDDWRSWAGRVKEVVG